ncbi:hypothetical protein GWO43_23300 [candidate division KSB1 bacterium]|nr:hypothetical protein [candidate division KSB1 bacterium]NIT73746.1 hypothetical protein [candidate division KSB1 bacterium]NIX73426.1 hypothetical protein [candidate division KSB1 bacterium]
MTKQTFFFNQNVVAWLALVSAVGLHVFDEAMTDFLPTYNQIVLDLRNQLGFFPAPTFSFAVWLTGLIAAIILGYSMTVFVARGGKVIRIITTILGILMVVNALSHFFGSIYYGKVFPGTWSSPFLLAAALFVTIRGFSGEWQAKRTADNATDSVKHEI